MLSWTQRLDEVIYYSGQEVKRSEALADMIIQGVPADWIDEYMENADVVGMTAAFKHNNVLADHESSWADVDKTTLPRLAFAGMGKPGQKSSWSYPHHFVKNGGNQDDQGICTTGTLYLHRQGLNAAWAAAQGSRSGQKAPPAVIAHLQGHRQALGLD
jgi:hypothetical protein